MILQPDIQCKNKRPLKSYRCSPFARFGPPSSRKGHRKRLCFRTGLPLWSLFPSGTFRTNGPLSSSRPFRSLLSLISLRPLVASVSLLTGRALDALLASWPLWAHISFGPVSPGSPLSPLGPCSPCGPAGPVSPSGRSLLVPGLPLVLALPSALRSRWPLELADVFPVHQVFRPDVDRVVIFRSPRHKHLQARQWGGRISAPPGYQSGLLPQMRSRLFRRVLVGRVLLGLL